MLLADHCVLAVFGFGADAPHATDPRYVRVPLEPYGNASLEVWRSNTPAHVGHKDGIAWASNGQLQFGTIALEENTQPIDICSEKLYTRLTHFVAGSSTPHLLRIWNYVDGITIGTGDNERYRKFNIGRARGISGLKTAQLPAATAIGYSNGHRILHVYWLASAHPGTPLENPVKLAPTATQRLTAHNLQASHEQCSHPATAQCHCCYLARRPSLAINPCTRVTHWHN